MANSTADIFSWTGSQLDGAWTNTNNWIIIGGSPAGTKPAAGEVAHFGDRALWPVYSGETGAVTLGVVAVTRECRVNIGATTANVSSPITNVNATVIRYGGSGALGYWNGTGATIDVDRAAGQYIQNGVFTNMRTFSGQVVVGSAATNTSAVIVNRGANLTVERNGTSVVSIDQIAGTTTMKRNWLTMNVGGGQLVAVQDAAAPSTDSVTKVFGGIYNDRSLGTKNQVDWYGGDVTALGNPNPTFTITTLNNYSGKRFGTRYDGGEAVVTTNNYFGGPDASLGNQGGLPTT